MAFLAQETHPPHYIAIAVADVHQSELIAREGAIERNYSQHNRFLDIDLRVGSPALDSSHPLRSISTASMNRRRQIKLPLTNGYALRQALWRALKKQYSYAEKRWVMVQAERDVKVAEESIAHDFEPRSAIISNLLEPHGVPNTEAWLPQLVVLSAQLNHDPLVHKSYITLQVDQTIKHFVDSEGSQIVHPVTHARIGLSIETTGDDGDQIAVFRSRDAHSLNGLPTPEEISSWIPSMETELHQRQQSPRGQPYSGPVILKGKATAVFFHEVLGHRVEGHRQKREDEGKTFAEYLGQKILPEFISVIDDPTVREMAGVELNGHYTFDDEGVAAQPAVLVENGVFRGFLMGRSPIPNIGHSNGHGRRGIGHAPTSRMGNTIIETSTMRTESELRKGLIREVKKQGLEYGILVDEIDGGFTSTGRITPNAFNVRATTAWRIFGDGRPDERVRGLDLVGTPLVAFNSLLSAGGEVEVFNGTCGAESGWVPVSAVAPSVLFRRLEFQLKEKGQDRPPILPKPSLSQARDSSAKQGESP